ncbi:ribonuclease PH [Stratiformator vulcanicus]|uniref:Ribonuclease PH n=1 Tax=Stratiformator vulcanicus TaxID=2527980 RepID=A0A517R5T2_9PLAN|nr:ribonuclease PH [Stratiformator vulcanicus]QDT39219.1 Ribonuclease PH [Stratiformator vulcanicus]
MRHDGRRADELRPITIQRPFDSAAPGSVLISAGQTTVLCTASIEESVPPWKKGKEPISGWVTAEYSMLPGSTAPRKARRADGRSTEIQRLIGRSLRSVVDFEALGERTIVIDCDVLRADGGTRTLSITGGFVALCAAIATLPDPLVDRPILKGSIAAISVGVVDGKPVLDLDYHEDSTADVDLNVVMTGVGTYVEVQGTAEGQAFPRGVLEAQLDLAEGGIVALTELQRHELGGSFPGA